MKISKVEYAKTWNKAHPERHNNASKRYYYRHREAVLAKVRKRRQKQLEKHQQRENKYNINHRAERAAYAIQYRATHRKLISDKARKYYNDHKEEIKLNRSPQYIIKDRCQARIKDALKREGIKKISKTAELLGCSISQFKAHLESRFSINHQTGELMTWENRDKWHIDHIRPCASFELTDPEQQKQCFHYTNLQPLWATENLKKGAKLL